MKTLFVLPLLFMSAIGCATSYEHSKTSNSRPDLFAMAESVQHADLQTCKSELSSVMAKNLDPKVDKIRCNMVSYLNEINTDSIVESCIKRKKKLTECNKEITTMTIAQFQLKYPKGDWNKVDLQCKANPAACDLKTVDGKGYFEFLLRKSHEESILINHEIARYKQQKEEEAREEISRQNTANFWSSVGEGLKDAAKQTGK